MRPLLALACCLGAASGLASAAELSTDAKGAIPENVQQLIVIDYDAMQNSSAAMDLKNSVMPPELVRLEKALTSSGLDDNDSVDELAFASFRPDPNREGSMTIGVAQGQFSVADIVASLKKHKIKPKMLRTNQIWPMSSGMVVCFVSPTTMIFGDSSAMKYALDSRDGYAPSMLKNSALMQQVGLVESQPFVERSGRQGHPADDAERARPGVPAGRLQFSKKAFDQFALQHELQQWG